MTTATTTVTFPTPLGPVEIDVEENYYPGFRQTAQSGTVYEPKLAEAFGEVVTAESVVYDVGANYGYYAHVAALAGGTPTIHCFESNGRLIPILERNLRALECETVIEGTRVGSSQDTLTLDSYAASLARSQQTPPPSVVKIDTEGDEYAILRGATNIIQDGAEWFIEMHPVKLQDRGLSAADVFGVFPDEYSQQWIDHRDTDATWGEIGNQPTTRTYLFWARP